MFSQSVVTLTATWVITRLMEGYGGGGGGGGGGKGILRYTSGWMLPCSNN
jgi:hypothetical protein